MGWLRPTEPEARGSRGIGSIAKQGAQQWPPGNVRYGGRHRARDSHGQERFRCFPVPVSRLVDFYKVRKFEVSLMSNGHAQEFLRGCRCTLHYLSCEMRMSCE